MTNYYGKSINGHTLRSSTFFIHDEDDNIIGALCLNYDVQRYLDVRKQLDALVLMDTEKRWPTWFRQLRRMVMIISWVSKSQRACIRP